MIFAQLILLLLALTIIRSLSSIGNTMLSVVFSFILGVIYVIQLSSVIITGEVANYRFYENINVRDILSVMEFYGKEGFLIFFGLILSTIIIHILGLGLRNKIQGKKIVLSILVLSILFLSMPGGIINNAYSTVRLKFSNDTSFAQALNLLQIDDSQYLLKDEIKAQKGKNIVVLSLESFEKGYLGEQLNHLTPNLSKIAEQHTFFTMKQTPAGSWTSASMYIAMTGVPAYFGIHGNSIFQKSYANKLITMADVLKTAGYDLQYFIGNKEFSGISDMLETFGFTVKSEKDFSKQYEKVPWGIQDKDLFNELKKELLQKKKVKTPFAIFLSTISTHFPDGVKDKRFDSLFPAQKSTLELMAAATDYMVGDLVDFLEAEEMLSNTIFYIYPDHLLMGTKSRVLSDFGARSLFLMTNAEADNLDYSVNEEIYQIDLPKIILEGAGIKHNAKFLTDYILEKDKNAFLKKNERNLLQLNEAALKTLNCQEGIYIFLNEEKREFEINNNEGLLVLSGKLPERGSCQRILFDETLRPYNDFQIEVSKVSSQSNAYAYLDIFVSGGLFYGSLKDKYHFGITKNGSKEIVFDKTDLSLIENIDFDRDIQDYISLSSHSWNAKKPSGFVIKGNKENITRGLTIISFNRVAQFEFRTFDTHSNNDDTKEFMTTLKKLLKNNNKFILLAHDSAVKNLQKDLMELRKMGFPKLSSLLGRQAYIMHNLDGKIIEKVDKESIVLELPYPNDIKSPIEYFTIPKTAFEPNVNRYIAHAGGSIDGIRYTDSKEALDFSYSQGFRLFELDIIETADGFFVAAHDWKHWAKETDYKNNYPVNRQQFLLQKIRGKYSPLDMDGINKWFSAHPDAILITDKVNKPVEFAEKFIDRNRLIMELFTLSAIEEAAANGVSALISQKPLSEIKGDKITYLKKNNVSHVAMSRRNIVKNKSLIDELMKNNIKVYVYNVNFDPGKDEQYVLDNEIGYVYGMYADKWIPAFLPSSNLSPK